MDDTQDKGGLMASATPSNGEALAVCKPVANGSRQAQHRELS
jgi:hypothetical protein